MSTLAVSTDHAEPCGQRFVASRSEPLAVAVERPAAADASLELIEELYREHAARFRRVALAIVANSETAEDVVQEAFARAVVTRASFRASGPAAAWIWRIVVNTALSRVRRARLETRAVQTLTLGLRRAHVDTYEDGFRRHLCRLPERQRAALFLRYYADLDYDAIGEVLEISPGTVGKLLHDARARLRVAAEGEGRE
jgi:RNA polymerase sigma-70 factor (ECF subfamily)